jgi:hypothetical protein
VNTIFVPEEKYYVQLICDVKAEKNRRLPETEEVLTVGEQEMLTFIASVDSASVKYYILKYVWKICFMLFTKDV